MSVDVPGPVRLRCRMSRARDLRVRRPCPLKQLALTGARTWCDHCEEHVHDLTACTEAEAEVVLADPAVRCVAMRVDARGMARFRPAVLAVGLAACAHQPGVVSLPHEARPASVIDVKHTPAAAEPGRFEILVVDQHGLPLGDVHVSLEHPDPGQIMPTRVANGRTDWEGAWAAGVAGDAASPDLAYEVVAYVSVPLEGDVRTPYASYEGVRLVHRPADGTAVVVRVHVPDPPPRRHSSVMLGGI